MTRQPEFSARTQILSFNPAGIASQLLTINTFVISTQHNPVFICYRETFVILINTIHLLIEALKSELELAWGKVELFLEKAWPVQIHAFSLDYILGPRVMITNVPR
jgi:hypothetical protein